MTVRELMMLFLESKRTAVKANDLSSTTLIDYVRELAWFERQVGNDTPAASLSPKDFAKVNGAMISERKLGRHARRRVIAYIKAMCNWGAGNGYIPALLYGTDFAAPNTSPDAMRRAKARAGVMDFSAKILSGEEVDKLLTAATAQYPAIVLLGLNCGLGPADIGRLRWSHLDLETGLLDMPRGKTGTARQGYLWKRTRKALDRVAKLKHAKAEIEKNGKNALVFVTRHGTPMYEENEKGPRQAISQTIARIVNRAGLEGQGITHYRFRHTFKTLGKKAKDRDALKLMMGHRDRTMGEVYDHEEISLARIKRVAVKVKRALWPKSMNGVGVVRGDGT